MTDHDTAADAAEERLTAEAYARVVNALRSVSSLRLDDYRRASVLRHMLARMRAVEVEGLDVYVARLGEDRAEAEALAHDIIESSTVLFRDPEAYASLTRCLPGLFEVTGAPRVWVPACAGGEDVYSIAMLLAEAQTAAEAPEGFSILGTDIDPEMLAEARRGAFGLPAAKQVPLHLRSRFLKMGTSECLVDRTLAAHCSFLLHDVTTPLPVGELDLVDCRNLISFLQLPVQRRALEQFRAALRPKGWLLVGRADAMAAHADLFQRHPFLAGLYVRVEPAPKTEERFETYRSALARSRTPGAVLDHRGRLIEINAKLRGLCRLPTQELFGKPATVLLHPADGPRLLLAISHLADHERQELDAQLFADGALLPARIKLSRWAQGERIFVVAEWLLDAEPVTGSPGRPSTLLAASLKLISESLIVVDTQGRITEFNRSAERLTGWSRDQALGMAHESVLRINSVAGGSVANPLADCLRDRDASHHHEDHQLLTREGHRLRVRLSCAPLVEDGEISGALLVLEDSTEQTLLSDELQYRSSHDAVTGLLNRSEFERRLSSALVEVRNTHRSQLLCYIDIDQFKVINDTLGHYAGDELLRQIATLFRTRLRAQDALARLGGDEFGVLLKDIRPAEARALVESLLEAARGFRFVWENKSHSVTVSIGVADVRGDDLVTTFADADAACYAAKDGGRDRARWVTDGHDEIHRRHAEMTMVGRIGKALDENRFLLYYEDVVSTTATSQVFYRELLVRMRGDDGRLVQPGGFIAAAERYYLMAALDRWIINAAFEGIARLPADAIIYAVNISGMSLSDDQFLNYVIRTIETTGVAPERICFEITETSAISHLTEAMRFFTQLAELGCRFALDDFGAGMASFSYLKNLPVQFVKIDGSFVSNMRASSVDRGMVEAINRIGHDMGLRTIAEHVEDMASLDMLAAMGVDWVQGKVFGEGRPFEELLAPLPP